MKCGHGGKTVGIFFELYPPFFFLDRFELLFGDRRFTVGVAEGEKWNDCGDA